MDINSLLEEEKEEYNSIETIWSNFKEDIQHKNRFFSGKEITDILDKLKFFDEKKNEGDSIMQTTHPVDGKLGLLFYRARIGNYINKDDKEVLEPPCERATAGRCNPQGVSYLYVASNEDTAIAETKPNKGEQVTVAKIRIFPKKIFSFNILEKADKLCLGSLIKTNDVRFLIGIINNDLSKVITINYIIEYLPFQFLAEYIKNRKIDVFSFSSSIAIGTNYVIFDSSNTKVESKTLYRIGNVNYEYTREECDI